MKKLRIWGFCISFLSFNLWGFTQEVQLNEKIKNTTLDSIKFKGRTPLSLRFGIDLYRLTRSQFSDDYNGIELVGDLQIKKKIFLALEIGTEETTKQSEQINFTTSGSYYKIGVNFNMYENLGGMNNNVYLGLRIASSSYDHVINSYTLLDRTPFWPNSDKEISAGFATGKRSNLNAKWLEFVAGFKVQLINNIYLGLSLRLNRLFSDSKLDNFDNIFIPGFNQKTDENKFGAGFNYTISYNIPFKPKKR
tara:strand:+ start:14888 stop:15637 length:750 start_codon:yes stop_codon:yes gene_type:complete